MLFSLPEFLSPHLSPTTQAFIRIVYGVLLIGTLLRFLPHGRRFFLSERWGGYAESARDVDVLHNPIAYPIVMLLWLSSGVLLVLGVCSVWAALLNLLFCRYYFISMRWKGIARGMGAPGFMTYWLAAAVFLLEYTAKYALDARSLALLVLQVDFALIMLSSGIYKFTAGYPRNDGMELGMVNPEWGYWWKFYARLSLDHWLIRTLNQLAWSTEVVAAILMLIPSTRFLGALLIMGSFAFVATQIRLGLLCEMVVLCGVLYFPLSGLGDRWISTIVPDTVLPANPELAIPGVANTVLAALLWAYLLLLPVAHAGLSCNFYAQKSFPGMLQRALEAYTNFFGILVWRVFSVNLVNFYIRIHEQKSDGERVLISRWGWGGPSRYNHVCESIVVTTLFTTLKYYPSNPRLFTERLLRYARTVPHAGDASLVFEYVSIRKEAGRFVFVPVAEYTVDAAGIAVQERVLDESVPVGTAHPSSRVLEGARPGSYAPLKG